VRVVVAAAGEALQGAPPFDLGDGVFGGNALRGLGFAGGFVHGDVVGWGVLLGYQWRGDDLSAVVFG